MNGTKFLELISNIVGQVNATRYASKFGNLDDRGYTNDILGYEALAFYVYTTALTWHSHINEQLWSDDPSQYVIAFAQVLDAAIRKLPVYKTSGGVVYRGYNTGDIDDFEERYPIGSEVVFHGFTSASFRRESAFGGNVLFIIRSLNARAIWFLAADYLEHEVLFPTACRFQVINVERDNDRLVVLLQEVEK